MTIRVIVNGAAGKMGKLACAAISDHSTLELVAGLTREDDLRHVIEQTGVQVVVDFTRADCVFTNASAIIESGAHPVIGTSGLRPEEIAVLHSMCMERKLGGLLIPNFSIAAVLMMRFAETAAHYLDDVAIIEAHHPQKFDAPSGTAWHTAERIARVRTGSQGTDVESAPSLSAVATAKGLSCFGVPVHSLRMHGVLADQEVVFGSTGETLSIQHRSLDRHCFMPGVLRCCEAVVHLDRLYEGMDAVLTM